MTFLPLMAYENWPIIKQLAWLLGKLMQGIFIVLSNMNILSVAACIIVFTIVTKMLMLPLTIQQQKFSKVNAAMTPEIQALQKKYQNRRDEASVRKMQIEQQQIYDKYGSSMSAGCLPSLIQFPILFALYPVIYSFEKYVPQMAQYSEEARQAMYMFLGINLMDAPGFRLTPALIFPILAGVFSFLSSKLMMVNQPNMKDSPMGNSMKTMNYTMPLFSAFICVSLPSFLGLYWVMQSVVMVVQQIAINKYMEKITIEDLIKQNIEKKNKKRAKKGLPLLNDKATVNTRKINSQPEKSEKDMEIRDQKIKESTAYYSNKSNQSGGSLAAKANMVRDYNERHKK